MKFKYYMQHFVDNDKGCVVWNLDYDRESDLDDSVGYWYVQPRSRESCRVYYSCDTKLRGWVPAPVYAILAKTAVKQATVWVNHESVAEWQKIKAEQKAQQGPLGLGARLRDARAAWDRALPPVKRRPALPSARDLKEKLKFWPPWARAPPAELAIRRGLANQAPSQC
mmetsp:Transcript_22822/g.69845  ORF Transcript_22822/g.69845 Transcript_22822/m.69845 type:complete len:168 (+) Transcript_22822:660-1163(+)